MPDSGLQRAEAFIIVLAIVGLVLTYVLRRLHRTRPGFSIAAPIAFGAAARVVTTVFLDSTGSASQLRGGDESLFLEFARRIAVYPWGSGNLPHAQYQLHTEVFAAQLKLLPISNTGLRVTQIGISMLGIVLIVAAVYDLAGGRAARLAAWLAAVEPSNVFFNSALHKEPLMLLASGLVVYGGTKIWKRLSVHGIALAALGSLIAVETRSYAGWFLVSATVLVLLVAGLRHLHRPLVAMPVVYAVVAALFLVTPTLLSVTSNKNLQTLQVSQNANAESQGQPGNNLALEKVNFSSRGQVLANLPKRVFDIVFRPFPWQLQNISQQLGAVGTMLWLWGLIFLFRFAWASRGRFIELTAPILFPAFFLLIAYALSAGNAGTGFRYRSHLVVLGAAMLCILREAAEVRALRAVQETDATARTRPSRLRSALPA